ncbi:hypothetical protein PR202_ga12033 [Eleusine coracana subsp. coracana]|uniref:Uncharacterized protein n=1 Tax=Eleusine coracana subsp. coracana TaxID=191504 RepID=A0AAV5CB70_ELECO|nr:hypothetical protein PR202_ga12033 [Eleusine coracana subsp. coracana]
MPDSASNQPCSETTGTSVSAPVVATTQPDSVGDSVAYDGGDVGTTARSPSHSPRRTDEVLGEDDGVLLVSDGEDPEDFKARHVGLLRQPLGSSDEDNEVDESEHQESDNDSGDEGKWGCRSC